MTFSEKVQRFMELFQVPQFLEPQLDRFVEPTEVELVLLLDGSDLTLQEVERGLVERLGEAIPEPLDRFVLRAWRRGLVDLAWVEPGAEMVKAEPLSEGACMGRSGTELAFATRRDGMTGLVIRAADFHSRFEIWAMHEGWKDLSPELRTRLNQWERDHYRDLKREQIEALKRGEEPDQQLENAEYLLPDEAAAVIDQVDHVYVWPCNCRAMMGECEKPVNVCLRFSNDRDLGWEISKERAKEILRDAHQAGLMHSGELLRDGDKIQGAICNCCSDCCFPHLVAEELGAQKLWPRSRHMARRDESVCTTCGRCARRCPFGAFEIKSTGKQKALLFHEEKCRGCAVCLGACREGAITLVPLEQSAPSAGPDEASQANRAERKSA